MDKNACSVFQGVVEENVCCGRCEVRGEGRDSDGAEAECGRVGSPHGQTHHKVRLAKVR